MNLYLVWMSTVGMLRGWILMFDLARQTGHCQECLDFYIAPIAGYRPDRIVQDQHFPFFVNQMIWIILWLNLI